MKSTSKPSIGWGDLNKALNALTKAGLILGYSTKIGDKNAETVVEVTIERGSDQAEVVRRVRASLPTAFSEAQVRTRTS